MVQCIKSPSSTAGWYEDIMLMSGIIYQTWYKLMYVHKSFTIAFTQDMCLVLGEKYSYCIGYVR